MRNAILIFLTILPIVGQAQTKRVFQTLAEMDVTRPSKDEPVSEVMGIAQPGDWGKEPRLFYYDPTSVAPTSHIVRAIGTNAVGRRIHKWNGDARVFGARNDSGVTSNNSPAIQAAADAASELGIPLVLEGDGTNFYQIDEGIALKSGTKVIGRNAWLRKKDGVGAYSGDPYKATIFRNADPDETVDANYDPITRDHDIELIGLGGFVIDGNGGNSQSQLTNAHPSHAIRFTGVNRVKIKDATIKDAAFFAILLAACRQVEVVGCTITNAFTSRNTDPDQGRNNDGIDLTGCVDAIIANNTVYATDDAIAIVTYASNSRNIVISGNLTHQMIGTNATWTPRGIAVTTGGITGPRTENVVVSANVANVRSGSGIAVFRTTGHAVPQPVKNILVADNIVIGDGTERSTAYGNVTGLFAAGVEGVDFTGNIVSNFVGRAVYVGNARRVRFIDNRIYTQRRQVVADATPYGFYLDTSSTNLADIEIRGGVIEDTLSGISSFPSTNYYLTNIVISGVRIANTASNTTTLASSLFYGAVHLFNAHKVRVDNLRIEDVPAAGISVLSGSDVEIRDNRVRGTDLPIVISGISGSRITGNWVTDQSFEPAINPAGAVYLWQNWGANTDCEISGNRFEGIPRSAVYVPASGAGTNLVVRDNLFLRGGTALVGVTNDANAAAYSAISITSPGGTLVAGNTVRSWDAGGIWLAGATNLVIRENTLDSIGITTNAHGIFVRADSADVPADLVTIAGNRISNVSGYGIGMQSPRRWNVSGNTLFNCSTINTGSAEIFIDVNGVTTVDTAGFAGAITDNTILSGGAAAYGIRGQVRNLPAGVNGGNWNGSRWIVADNTVRSSTPYNFTPTLQAVGPVESTPLWRSTIGTTNYTHEGHHKVLDWFLSADTTVTLPAAASMANFGELTIFKAGANTNQITVTRSGSDTINGTTSVSWTNQYHGRRFRAISGAWYAETVSP